MKARIADIGWIFRHGQPNGIRPLIIQRRKGAQRDPLLIPWAL
jgi:hypothetical protein